MKTFISFKKLKDDDSNQFLWSDPKLDEKSNTYFNNRIISLSSYRSQIQMKIYKIAGKFHYFHKGTAT